MSVIYSLADYPWYANNCVTTEYASATCAGSSSDYYKSAITDSGTMGCSYGYDSKLVNSSWTNPVIKYTRDADYGINETGGYAVTYPYCNPYNFNVTGTIPNDWYSYNNNVTWPTNEPAFKNAIFLQKLKSNLTIAIKSRADLPNMSDSAERTAMEALRESISETDFRKYLRYGFVLVKGKSGDTFQIFRNRSHTKVWRDGKVIEEICVRIHHDQKVPPTDNVIAFRSIIQTDEESFRKLGNVFKMNRAAA